MEREEIHQPPVLNTFWQYQGELRVVWKLSAFTGSFLLCFALALLVISPVWGTIGSDMFATLTMSIAVTGCTAFAYILLEKRPFLSVGLTLHRGWLRQLGAGWLYAAILITIVSLAELALGEVRIHPGFLTVESILGMLGWGLAVFTFVAYSEEVLVRGYPLQLLEQRTGRVPALLITSAAFSLMHLANPGISWLALVNIFLAGILLGSAYFLTRSLWLPIGMHHAWNFVQGNVFGFPVSGQYEPSVFVSINSGSEFVSGGIFGPEGGILASVVLVAGIAAMYHPRIAALMRGQTASGTPEHEEEKEIA